MKEQQQALNDQDLHDKAVVEVVLEGGQNGPESCTPEVWQWAQDWIKEHPHIQLGKPNWVD